MTLLEVLIGVMLLMIITSTMAQATWLTTRGKRRIEQRQVTYHQARMAMKRVVNDITLAFIVKPTLNALGRDVSAFKTAFIGEDKSEADALYFTSLSGRRYVAGEAAADQREIAFFLEDLDEEKRFTRVLTTSDSKQLVRREDTTLDDDVKDGGDKAENAVIAEGILKFNLEYWDPKKAEWVTEWDSTTRARRDQLPRAVRITMLFPHPLDEQGEPLEFQSIALLGLGPDPINLGGK